MARILIPTPRDEFDINHLPPLSVLALRAVVALVNWDQRRRSRRGLVHLDDHLLRDVGLSRTDVARELDRAFWEH